MAGLFGVGGNAVLVPALSFGLKLGQHDAQALTLAATLAPLGLPALLTYRRRGIAINWRNVVLGALGFLCGVAFGSKIANLTSDKLLRTLFAGILLYNAYRIWQSYSKPPTLDGGTILRPPWPFVFASGLAGGFASGLVGIGGALIFIPALRALGVGQKEAQATSLGMMLAPIGLPGVLVYAHERPGIEWILILPIAVAFVFASLIGARLMLSMSTKRLEWVFGVYLVVTAAIMLGRNLFGS